MTTTHEQQIRRATRVRTKLRAVSDRPRLHIFRSLRFISLQAIDDKKGVTIAAVHEKQIPKTEKRTDRLEALGTAMAAALKEAGVKQVAFDRGSYAYHGVVATVADSIRKAGIEF